MASIATTVNAGIAAPDESVTCPRTDTESNCASPHVAIRSSAMATRSERRKQFRKPDISKTSDPFDFPMLVEEAPSSGLDCL